MIKTGNKNRLVFVGLFFLLGSFSAYADPQTLSLEAAMDMSESYSFSARIAVLNQSMAEDKAHEQIERMLPSVSASGNYLKYSNHVNQLVGTDTGMQYGFPDTIVSSGALTLTQHIVGLVPLLLSLESANAAAEAALHSKEESKAQARFLGANAYINAVKAAQLLNVAQSSVKVAQIQLHDGVAQFNAGKLTNADVLKFKLNLENAKTTLIQSQTMAKMTLLTLGETVGIKDLKQIILPKNYVAFWEKKKIPSKELSEFMETAINQREDLKAIQASSISATKSLDLAESKYLPSIDFIATYTRNFQAKGLPGYGSKEVQDNFFYGLQLNWDILDWGVRQSQISQAFETKGTLSLQEEQSRSQIKIDVTNSFFNLKDAYQTLDSAKVSVDYAKDVYLQMEAQFNNGQATTTDVLAAADDQSSALAKLANATGDLDLAWLNLQKSIGKRLTTLNKG